jgi:hypothetical protein
MARDRRPAPGRKSTLGTAREAVAAHPGRRVTRRCCVGTTSVSYSGIDFLGDPGVLDGDIKGSRVGFGVTTANGDILTTGGLPGVFADIASITWHVPFLPDTNLSGLN